jgi:hypothetical protein
MQRKLLVYFINIWCTLLQFGILYRHLVYFCGNLVDFPQFGMLYEEKSGNSAVGHGSVLATVRPDYFLDICIVQKFSRITNNWS